MRSLSHSGAGGMVGGLVLHEAVETKYSPLGERTCPPQDGASGVPYRARSMLPCLVKRSDDCWLASLLSLPIRGWFRVGLLGLRQDRVGPLAVEGKLS
jgi:hypothetical protein